MSDMSSIVDSLVAPLSVINALIVAVASKKREEVKNKFENLVEYHIDLVKIINAKITNYMSKFSLKFGFKLD